ncbi:MAG: hypothetical protein DMF94_16680 [Acidobacteria bacterium]|nr:MAG: hypothetical protein DMF96_16545 [Acidobacteriota bacterium]PYR19260.1 MAG: hypothetical protein DMF94_16680 [Acidobacteriota bacterium]
MIALLSAFPKLDQEFLETQFSDWVQIPQCFVELAAREDIIRNKERFVRRMSLRFQKVKDTRAEVSS